MAKSHAQRQKEYRERKKANPDSNWLQNESKRTKSYYTKIDLLTEVEAKKRRKNLKNKQRQYRAKKKASHQEARGHEISTENVPTISSEERPEQSNQVSSSNQRLVVKLPRFKGQRRGTAKKHKHKIEYLQRAKDSLKKKNQMLRMRIFRMKKLSGKSTNASPKTPKSATERVMKTVGLTPGEHPEIRKKLVFANCLVNEIKENASADQKKSRLIKRVIAGNILRKYKLTQYAANLINVRIRYKKQHSNDNKKERCNTERKRIREKIKRFLEREDNSRQLPGKADVIKNENKIKVQKFVLNDYLRNIYLKFKAEHPEVKVSFATFCRARPKYITLVNYAGRVTCLCTKHQNFALKLQCLKKYSIVNNTSPDNFSEVTSVGEMDIKLSKLTEPSIDFKQWKRIKCDDGKQRTKLLDIKKDRLIFTEDMSKEYREFKDHAGRVKTQYQSFKEMKESIKNYKDHVCIQMDFAENYTVKEREEIQSAYWNPESVTLHPVVVYWCKDDAVTHSSMVFVSEVLNHNSSMVQAIVKKVIVEVKKLCPDVSYIHYWTDSPTSQYRNRLMFDLVSRHQQEYNIKASWQYFEAGHGKGACDGVGGAVKRSADTAIKTGKVNITKGRDFYEWGAQQTGTKIRYIFVEREEYEASCAASEIRQKDVNVIKGTLKIHSVVGVSNNEIMVRDTTCVCEKCFTDQGFTFSESCGWKIHMISKGNLNNTPQIQDETAPRPPSDTVPSVQENCTENIHVAEGDFVAALYDDNTFIGKIVDIDDGQYEVSFMESGSKVKNCLKWPKREDKIWVEPDSIICKVSEPVATGRGKRMFKLTDVDMQRLNESSSL